jgi:hypothetical protein
MKPLKEWIWEMRAAYPIRVAYVFLLFFI